MRVAVPDNEWGYGIGRMPPVEEPEDWLLERYDANEDGVIQRSEVITAITDYFAGLITREDVIHVIGLYFAGG